MKRLLFAFLLCALVGQVGVAQNASPPHVRVVLPELAEMPGFSRHRYDALTDWSASVSTLRDRDNLRLEIITMKMATTEEAKRWPKRYNTGVQLAGAGLKRVAHPALKTGQQLWSDRTEKDSPFRLALVDGRSVVTVLVAPGFDRDAKGFPHQRNHSDAEVIFAEKLAFSTMERLTVIGLTSQPVASASERAKRQVARQTAIMRATRQVPPDL